MVGKDSIDISNEGCVGKLISKVLSLAIIVGAGILKVPQISRSKNKSVEGIVACSISSSCLTATVVYSTLKGYPLTTYGESVIITGQVLILVFLLWTYSKPSATTEFRIQCMVCYGAIVASMLYLPEEFQPVLLTVGTVLTVSSRVPQILANFRAGSSGQVSLITWALNSAGGAARIFTTLQEVNDPFVLAGFVLGFVTSATLAFQVVLYSYILKKKDVTLNKSHHKNHHTKT